MELPVARVARMKLSLNRAMLHWPFSRMGAASLASVVLAGVVVGCARNHADVLARRDPVLRNVDVVFVTDEADAALDIIRAHSAGDTPSAQQWSALFGSQGYARLKEREAAMGREFTDSSFASFVTADSVAARSLPLERAVSELKHANVAAAASMALAYLPAGTPLRARLYLEIKPITNTFVFTGRDSIPSIFLYVQPSETRAQLQNTLAHELHHIGTNAACNTPPSPESAKATPAVRMLLDYLTAFSEGRAMLAAAGGPDVHPHEEDPDSLRKRWDHDLARAPDDVRDLSAFFADVVSGRIATADSVKHRGNSYFGYQGPWYTVGWLMSSTVERELGRDALVSTLCKPVNFLAQYNQAAERSNASRRTSPPLWPAPLLEALSGISR